MSQALELVEATGRTLRSGDGSRPDGDTLVSALLELEKTSTQRPDDARFENLLGTWRLGWITGTKRSQQRAGVVLGSGRYLPGFFQVFITYEATGAASDRVQYGRVENCVRVGGLTMKVTGPVGWQKTREGQRPKTLLAFDFTRLEASLLGVTVFNNFVRDGAAREATFQDKSIAQQAFFNYFYIGKEAIAARGRGGGLALWYAVEPR